MKGTPLKRVCVCGHFGFGQELLNGQTVKTKIVADALAREFGPEEMLLTDTHGGAKILLKLPFQCLNMLRSCRHVVILPAHNGLRVIAPLLAVMNLAFHRKLHYVVIGGWLPHFLEKRPLLSKILKRYDGIYVETSAMRTALEAQGFRNLRVMPNCKDLMPLTEAELVFNTAEPYRLCTFSRVMREKGIEDAVEAVKAVNARFGRTVYTLDIYGQVDPGQTEWFDNLQTTFPEEICYRGAVPFDGSVAVLKDYFALLFPTRFHTEGIPGTIIDAYAAGVPVISSRWESFCDMVEDGHTGLGYPLGETEKLTEWLIQAAVQPEMLRKMKPACLKKAQMFRPESALAELIAALSE